MFDPTETWRGEVKEIRRAQFWRNFKLWLYATLIFGIPLTLILWCIWEWL